MSKQQLAFKNVDVFALNRKRLDATRVRETSLELLKNLLEYSKSEVVVKIFHDRIEAFNDISNLSEYKDNMSKLYHDNLTTFKTVKGFESSNFHEGMTTYLLFKTIVEVSNLKLVSELVDGGKYYQAVNFDESSHISNDGGLTWEVNTKVKHKNTNGFKVTLFFGENMDLYNCFMEELNNTILFREDITFKLQDMNASKPKIVKFKKQIPRTPLDSMIGGYTYIYSDREHHKVRYHEKIAFTDNPDDIIEVYWKMANNIGMVKSFEIEGTRCKGYIVVSDIRVFANVNRNSFITGMQSTINDRISMLKSRKENEEKQKEIKKSIKEYEDYYVDFLNFMFGCTKKQIREVFRLFKDIVEPEHYINTVTNLVHNLASLSRKFDNTAKQLLKFQDKHGKFKDFMYMDEKGRSPKSLSSMEDTYMRSEFLHLISDLKLNLREIFPEYKLGFKIIKDLASGKEIRANEIHNGDDFHFVTSRYMKRRHFGMFTVNTFKYRKPTIFFEFDMSEWFVTDFELGDPDDFLESLEKEEKEEFKEEEREIPDYFSDPKKDEEEEEEIEEEIEEEEDNPFDKQGKPTKIKIEDPKLKENGDVEVPSPTITPKVGDNGTIRIGGILGGGLVPINAIPASQFPSIGDPIASKGTSLDLKTLKEFAGISVNGKNKVPIAHMSYEGKDTSTRYQDEKEARETMEKINKLRRELQSKELIEEGDSSKMQAGLIYDNKIKGGKGEESLGQTINYLFNCVEDKDLYEKTNSLGKIGASSSINYKFFSMWVKTIEGILSVIPENFQIIPFLMYNKDDQREAFMNPHTGICALNLFYFDSWEEKNKKKLSADQIGQYLQNIACHELAHLKFKDHDQNHERYMEKLIMATIMTDLVKTIKKVYSAKNLVKTLGEIYAEENEVEEISMVLENTIGKCHNCGLDIIESEIGQRIITQTKEEIITCKKCHKGGHSVDILGDGIFQFS